MVIDKGSQVKGDLKNILQNDKIKCHQSSPYCPQTSRLLK